MPSPEHLGKFVNLNPFYQDIYVYYIASSNIKFMGNIILNCDLEEIPNWVRSSVENVIYSKSQAQVVIFSSKRVKDCHPYLLNDVAVEQF